MTNSEPDAAVQRVAKRRFSFTRLLLQLVRGVLAVVGMFLLMFLLSPIFHNSREEARLFLEVREHPSREALARLDAIHARQRRDNVIWRLTILGLVLADACGIWLLSRAIRKGNAPVSQVTSCPEKPETDETGGRGDK